MLEKGQKAIVEKKSGKKEQANIVGRKTRGRTIGKLMKSVFNKPGGAGHFRFLG